MLVGFFHVSHNTQMLVINMHINDKQKMTEIILNFFRN